MHPQELLALVHYSHETAVAGIFGFEQGMKLAQSCTLSTDSFASLQSSRVCPAKPVGDFLGYAQGSIDDF